MSISTADHSNENRSGKTHFPNYKAHQLTIRKIGSNATSRWLTKVLKISK